MKEHEEQRVFVKFCCKLGKNFTEITKKKIKIALKKMFMHLFILHNGRVP
jgi:hypothetical protein